MDAISIFICYYYFVIIIIIIVVLSLNGGYSRSIIGDSLILRPHDQANYNDIDQCKERSAGAVTWCLNIWHPTESIVACLNSTSQYSSNVAEELGIENDLVYLDSCTAFGDTYHGCLKIKYVRTFHDRSFVSYTVDEGNCVVNSFYNIFVRGNKFLIATTALLLFY